MNNYSIIIPHKNIPNLLQKCLDSIPTRDDIQIIVIDDDSSSEYVDFDKFPGKDKKNVTIIFDKSHRGAGHARNIGIEKSTGHWLIFSDADDCFNEEAFATFDKYRDSTYDIIYFGTETIDKNGIATNKGNDEENAINKQDTETIRYISHVPWGKMYSIEMIHRHKIRFSETIAANDSMFVLLAGYYANQVRIDSNKIYVHIIRTHSLTQTFTREIKMARLNIFCERNRFIINNHIPIKATFLLSLVNSFKEDGHKTLTYWKALLFYLTHQPLESVIQDIKNYYFHNHN